jgi:hypothetical protein
MPWTCFQGRIGVKNTLKIYSKHPDELLEPRGEYSVDSKVRYLKVLEYQYFCPHFVFHRLPDGSREKEIKQFIDVSVVLFLE